MFAVIKRTSLLRLKLKLVLKDFVRLETGFDFILRLAVPSQANSLSPFK